MTFFFHFFLTFPLGKFTKPQTVLAWNNSEYFHPHSLGRDAVSGDLIQAGMQCLPAETDSANRLSAISVQSKKGSLLGQIHFTSSAAYQCWE